MYSGIQSLVDRLMLAGLNKAQAWSEAYKICCVRFVENSKVKV